MIAMMLADWLIELGKQPVGPTCTVAETLQAIGGVMFDAAILDVNLRNERCDPIAGLLQKMAIPFAFATGGDWDSVSLRFGNTLKLMKPYDFEDVRKVVELLCKACVEPRPVIQLS